MGNYVFRAEGLYLLSHFAEDECQLGELEVAKARLGYAFKLDEKLRALALDDADLQPFWDSLNQ